jgi:hypothetical protein
MIREIKTIKGPASRRRSIDAALAAWEAANAAVLNPFDIGRPAQPPGIRHFGFTRNWW